MKKILIAVAATCLAVAGLAACGNSNNGGGTKSASIYFLNFKPEVAEVWTQIAADYKAETGIDVKIDTAASGTYEQTLKSEIAKSNPPTIFQINGPVGYNTWKTYTADIKDSWLYQHLSDPGLAVTDGDGVFGVPYAVEAYGIIYNDAIMQQYFALPDKAVSLNDATEIQDFATLKQVAEDMSKHLDALGIEGVFSATSLQPGEDWRWQTHLANVPFHYEFLADGINLVDGTPPEVKFAYNENFKNLFDLYLDNSTTSPNQLGSITVDLAMAEFAAGQTAMVQNGNWAWSQINGMDGNTVQAADIKFLPLYTGMPEDNSQGLCVGTENYFSINSQISDESKQASLAFLEWVFSSETGMKYVQNDLGFVAPFDTFGADQTPDDPLAQQMNVWMNQDGVSSVPWDFTVFPGQQFKDQFGGYLLQYAQGQMDWATVVSNVVQDWQYEAANLAG